MNLGEYVAELLEAAEEQKRRGEVQLSNQLRETANKILDYLWLLKQRSGQ